MSKKCYMYFINNFNQNENDGLFLNNKSAENEEQHVYIFAKKFMNSKLPTLFFIALLASVRSSKSPLRPGGSLSSVGIE